MQLTKHIGCLLALVFATASAFADATWFTTAIGAMPTSSYGMWTLPLTGTWTYDTVGKLNSPDGELKFEVSNENKKTLPGDVATVKTSVKFTAMDMADFAAQSNSIPVGAKGGLTIVEDSDVTPPTTNFYGIVNGKWTQLAGDTYAALTDQVDVEVSIWENNGKHISYKVGDLVLTADSAANFSGDSISSVSYKGVCEIASLQGDAEDALWTMTLQTIAQVASAVVTLADNTTANVTFVNNAATVEVKAKNLPKLIEFAPVQDLWFFNGDAAGTQSFPKQITATVDGDETLSTAADFTGLTISTPVAKLDGNNYASLGAAIKAVEAVNKEVVLAVERTEDVSTANSYGFVLNLGAKTLTGSVTAVLGAGEIKIVNGEIVGNVTAENQAGIVFAKRDADGDIKVNGTLTGIFSADTGCYSMRPDEIKPICADGFFANANDDITFITKIVKGEEIEPSGDVPAITVDPAELADKPAGKSAAEYLAEPIATDATIKRWQSYALGLGTQPEKLPEFGASDTKAQVITVVPNFTPVKGSGVTVKYQLDDGTASTEVPEIDVSKLPEINLSELSDVSELSGKVVRHEVKVLLNDGVVASTTIGANKVAAPATGTRSLVTVPWADTATGTGVTIANLFKTAELTFGDKIEVYDQESDTYTEWVWNGSAWLDDTQSLAKGATKDAATTVVNKGQALWYTGKNAAIQFGVDRTAPSTMPVIAGKWGFAANPISGTAKELSAIVAPTAAPTAQVQLTSASGATTIYFVGTENGVTGWGYNTVVDRKRKFKLANPSIAPGQEFWFDNKDPKNAANLAW